MSDKESIDWDNLSFDDLERIDFDNIPIQHLDEVSRMLCLRKFHTSGNLSNRSLSKLTKTHHNTIGRKAKGLGDFSVLDFIIMFAVREMPQEDIDALANKGGKVNLSKIWEIFK